MAPQSLKWLTFFRSFPRMWHCRWMPSKQYASNRPFPSILMTWAYSWPSSLKISSLLSLSFSFLPLLLFLPPLPRKRRMMGGRDGVRGEEERGRKDSQVPGEGQVKGSTTNVSEIRPSLSVFQGINNHSYIISRRCSSYLCSWA